MSLSTGLFINTLKRNKYFATKPRRRLFHLLADSPALSISEIIATLPYQDQATVYRNLDLFERLGITKSITLGKQQKIELTDAFDTHHHHFTCLHCHKVFIIHEDPLIEQRIANMTTKNGFTATDHTLEIRGKCKTCG